MTKTAQPTAYQISNLRNLAAKYRPGQVDEIVAAGSVSLDAFLDVVNSFEADVTAARPARKTRKTSGPKATDRQVAYAARLIARTAWSDTDWGQDGSPAPTGDELAAMTRTDISDLIDSLK